MSCCWWWKKKRTTAIKHASEYLMVWFELVGGWGSGTSSVVGRRWLWGWVRPKTERTNERTIAIVKNYVRMSVARSGRSMGLAPARRPESGNSPARHADPRSFSYETVAVSVAYGMSKSHSSHSKPICCLINRHHVYPNSHNKFKRHRNLMDTAEVYIKLIPVLHFLDKTSFALS